MFGVAGRVCACDLGLVREIVPARPATRLPGAPAWVCGLINLRGTLLTVVDLAERLGVASGGAGMRSVIVAEAGGRVFGIGVDDVRDVQAVADDAVEPVDVARAAGGIVSGLVKVEAARGGGMALVCDVNAIAREALAL
jgi:purine-binding chemotaxis protein CheW